ncbi:tannase and feruloyl esterase [Periconia macrospinosa]|uniref:Carboxylic ester hydrolase n=1 Tax=Periconia macrospinosa TaxID=97972 RepID=A0A2V1DK54_9PLEO|nr:tannase and feruloyl esterase [Periconia macrospinosa]
MSSATMVENLLLPPCEAKTFQDIDIGTGVTILSTEATARRNYNTTSPVPFVPSFKGLDFCQIKISYNPAGSTHEVGLEVWLPLTRAAWSGRYQATGGAAFRSGVGDLFFGQAVHDGYAVSSTDGGNRNEDFFDISWGLKDDKTIDWERLQIAYTTSIVDQILITKNIVANYYGETPRYSYWNGCSQAGRQGYMLAQQYPYLLDGILANAPAIGFTDLAMGDFWPQLVMKEAGLWMSSCQFDFFRQKAMEACDMSDGVSDGVISDPDICDFDPLHVVGKTYYCDGEEAEVTTTMANIVRKIEQGPTTPMKTPIWHGFSPSTSMETVGATKLTADKRLTSNPYGISSSFIKNLLLKDASFNLTSLTYTDFMALWTQATQNFSWLWDATNPNLHNLKHAKTKLLTYHGLEDTEIPYQNTLRYRKRVELVMGGANAVDEFYRVFLAPGVRHCFGGTGPEPLDPLAVLVDWVEKGEAPETMDAGTLNNDGELVTRELCAFPAKAKYMGLGDAKRASSWSCVGGTERHVEREEEFEGEEQQVLGDTQAGKILGGLRDRFEGLNLGLRIG